MLTQLLAARFGDQIIVFKSHAALAFDVAARFECDHVAGNQDIVTFGNQDWRFRMFKAKPMASVMRQRPKTS